MEQTLRSFSLTVCAAAMLGAVACDKKEEAPADKPAKAAQKDEPAPSEAKAEVKPEPPADEAPPEADAAPSESAVGANGIPEALAEVVTLPEGSERIEDPQLSLFSMMAPKGTKLGRPNDQGWRTLTAGDLSMSIKAFNPSGDDHPDCPSVDDAKAKLGGATIQTDQSFSTTTDEENTSYGEEAQLVVFEDGDKVGFYARKLFDHGDDATTYCCTPGTPKEADGLAGRVDVETAKKLAGMCMSLRFTF